MWVYQVIQTSTLALNVKWKGLISIHFPLYLAELLLSRRPLWGTSQYYTALFFFNVLSKSCGEITRARSPPFVTDGKPFQRDYDALDLLSFSFLLKPRYQLSVSRALDPLRWGAHVSVGSAPSPLAPLWPLCLCRLQLSGNTMTWRWHLKCTLIVLCWALLPLSNLL